MIKSLATAIALALPLSAFALSNDPAGNRLRVDTLGTAGTAQRCRNSCNPIATCSSSARYKQEIDDLEPGLAAGCWEKGREFPILTIPRHPERCAARFQHRKAGAKPANPGLCRAGYRLGARP